RRPARHPARRRPRAGAAHHRLPHPPRRLPLDRRTSRGQRHRRPPLRRPAGPGPAMRHPVHAASGHRLGASHPRQEAPADLRLVVPALAVWATAALTLHSTPGRVAAVAVLAGTGAGVLLLLHRTRPGGDGATTRTDRNVLDRNVLDRNVLDRDVSVPTGARITAAAALLGIATAAVAAGLHGADLRRGPVPDLAREYARVTAEVEITADPRRARPGPGGGFAP